MNYVYIKNVNGSTSRLNIVKFIKNELGIGLKEAKDMVDSNDYEYHGHWRYSQIEPIPLKECTTVKAAKEFCEKLKQECPNAETEILKTKRPVFTMTIPLAAS